MNKFLAQIRDLQVLEPKAATLSKAKSTMDEYMAREPKSIGTSRAIQAYNLALAAYNTELAKYKSKYTSYTNPVIIPSKDLTDLYNSIKLSYNAKSDSLAKAKLAYLATYKQNNTLSAEGLTAMGVATLKKINDFKATQKKLTTLIAKSKSELTTLEENFATAVKSYKDTYSYETIMPDTTTVQAHYDREKDEYSAIQTKNDEIKGEIEKLNNTLALYNNTLNEITGKITTLQANIGEKNAQLSELI